MYEWVPFLKGSYFTYAEYASGILFAILLVIAGLCSLVVHILKYFKKCSLPTVPSHLYQLEEFNNPLFESRYASKQYVSRPYNESHSLEYLKRKFEESNPFNFFIQFFTWAKWFFFSLTPLAFSLFGVVLSPVSAALSMFFIFYNKMRQEYHYHQNKIEETLRFRNPAVYAKESSANRLSHRKKLLLVLFISFTLAFTFSGGCLAFYEEYVGFKVYVFNLSTTFSRYFELNDACPPGPPCHIYATLPEDASTGVFINVQTNVQYEKISIFYDTKDYYDTTNSLRYSQEADTIKLDHLEQRGRRSVHSALLNNLIPNTLYEVQIHYDNQLQASFNYETFPDETSTRNLVISTGGDLGDRNVGRQMTLQVGLSNPDVIVVGGDLAYDDGLQTCYFTWDNFLRSFAVSTLNAGRLIPFLFSIGNHDLGLNPLSQRNLSQTAEGPLYHVFFPQNTVPGLDQNGNPISKVPALPDRRSYHYHKLGKLVHLNLDSGYVTYFNEQMDFISTVAKAYQRYIKIVSLHNPAYYACKINNDQAVQETIMKWIPLFDQYKFMSIFENHEHCFKKSFPLKGGHFDEDGIYYLGNGNWGAQLSHPCRVNNATGILEVANADNHYWLVNVSYAEGLIRYSAFDSQGDALIPPFEQEIQKYITEEMPYENIYN